VNWQEHFSPLCSGKRRSAPFEPVTLRTSASGHWTVTDRNKIADEQAGFREGRDNKSEY